MTEGKVVDFPVGTANLTKGEKYLSGPARCLNPDCLYKFVAVAPIGTGAIECPKCHGVHAARFAMVLKESQAHWHCRCGNGFFLITPTETYCPNCGTPQEF